MQQTAGRRGPFASVAVALVAAALLALTSLSVADASPSSVAASSIAAADANSEGAFVAAVNDVRQSHGLAPLMSSGDLVAVARPWADRMAAAGSISHNPNLAGAVAAPWHKLGENVGVGFDVSSLMSAFVNSPAHYKNIVDPDYNYIGVGVSYGLDGRMYTTHDFMALDVGDDAPPPPDPPPPPAPRPAATAPAPDPPPAVEEPPPPVPAPPPPPPADPARVHAVLTALRTVSG